ncbi:MAG: SIS domain-containing protein [Dongiaceae bacterium]
MKARKPSGIETDIAGRTDDIAVARRVLAFEAQGLQALGAGLGDAFVRALDLLAGATGRAVITGIGKSGHVARKIAATLASTGTPSFFVHPAEASHGDLGMIAPGDAVIALSNSGGSAELTDIVAYTRRFAIPLVAITSRATSALAEAADATLVLPRADEACPMGLAPTTSTTMMLALGDAIAVALMERKRFTPGDFHALHPGGQLGRRLRLVSDLMHGADELPVARPDTPMSEVLIEMSAKRFGCVGIVDAAGKLAGIITDGDLRRHMSPDMLEAPAAAVMTANPRSIRPNALAAEALRLMNGGAGEQPVTVLFVVAEGRPVGILHIHDCLRAGEA